MTPVTWQKNKYAFGHSPFFFACVDDVFPWAVGNQRWFWGHHPLATAYWSCLEGSHLPFYLILVHIFLSTVSDGVLGEGVGGKTKGLLYKWRRHLLFLLWCVHYYTYIHEIAVALLSNLV